MKKLSRVILCVLIFTFFTGCGRQNVNEIDMTCFRNALGEYQFYDIAWNSTPKEVENYIGSTLESLGTVQEHETFMAEATYQWGNVEGEFLCEFGQDKLDNVSILFKPEDSRREDFWNQLVETLTTTYGEVEPIVLTNTSEELQITTESITYLWENVADKRTALTITKSSHNGTAGNISLRVYVIQTEMEQ